jgi:hypothetical protein
MAENDTEVLESMEQRAVTELAIGDLDAFIDRKVQQYCPAPRCVSDTALRQLRRMFEELLRVRVALEDVLESYDAMPEDVEPSIADAIERGRKALR